MKRKIFAIITLAALIFSLSACSFSSKEDDKKTVKAFIAMNEKIQAVESAEIEAMDIYSKHFSDGALIDREGLVSDLDSDVIPKYETFMKNLNNISVDNKEVKEIYDLYHDSMELQYEALLKIKDALAENSEDYQNEAEKLKNQAEDKYADFKKAVEDFCKKYDVETSDAAPTTEISSDTGETSQEDTTATTETDTSVTTEADTSVQ